jgi:hypothetical protein
MCFGLVEQKGSFPSANFDLDRAGTSENPNKIDFPLQFLGF